MSEVWFPFASACAALVFYLGALSLVYLPLALAYPFWERRLLERARREQYTPRVSVIVPAYNEAATIEMSIASILACDYPVFEVIVVDDGSTDATADRLAPFAADGRIRLLRQSNAGKGLALNAGLALASGELVLFTDADTLFEPQTLRNAVRYFADPSIGALGGNDTPVSPSGWLQRLLVVTSHIGTGFVRRALSLARVLPIIPGNLGMVRTSVLREIGGFRPLWGEDLELTWRLHRHGVRIVYGAQARVLADCPATLRALWRQRVRWVRSYLKVLRLHLDMVGNPRFGAFGVYLLFNVANLMLVPLAQLLLLAALPVAIATSRIELDVLGWIVYLGLAWLIVVATIAILLDRTPRDFIYLPHLALLIPLSQFYNAVVLYSLWAELTTLPERWIKLDRRDLAAAARVADRQRREVVLGSAALLAVAGGAVALGTIPALKRSGGARAHGAEQWQLAASIHFPDWPDWRDAYRSLLARPESRHLHRVAVSAGRADWTFFRGSHGRTWWSNTQRAQRRDMIGEAIDELHDRGYSTTVMLDVFAPRYLEQRPGHAAVDLRGRRSADIVCSTVMAEGEYGRLLSEAFASLAARTDADSVAATELFFDRHCYCERCLDHFCEHTQRNDWPRQANGSIDRLDLSLGRWRSLQVAAIVRELRAAAHTHDKQLLLDVKLSRDEPMRNSVENGQDYTLLRPHVDQFVVWDYFALDDTPAARSKAVATYLHSQFGAKYWHSIGLWRRNGATLDATQMLAGLAAAYEGGARHLWITPGRRLGDEHWQQLEALTERLGARS